jgi:cytidylate kinase
MNHKTQSERLMEALQKVMKYWESQKVGARQMAIGGHPIRPFTIAISRESGARGTSTAREVGSRLGWLVYDHELVERIAKEMNLRTSLLESVDEKRVSWLQECVESFASAPSVTKSGYVRHLVQTLLSLATHGECVIVGRGAAQILPAETTLRVRLVAPAEWRIVAVAQKLDIAKEAAASQVAKIDCERHCFVKDHFHKDPTDATQYDLILNSSRYSVSECADLIVEALRRLQTHTSVESPPVAHARRG